MGRIVSDEALDALFRAVRRPAGWLSEPVGDTLLRALWELTKLGPSAGAAASVVFVRSDAARARLAAAVPAATGVAIGGAPVTAIIAGALDRDRRDIWREAGLCTASLILAARSLGLECVPIWDFDAASVDAAFFPDGDAATDCLCALGYGDDAPPTACVAPAGPDGACRIL
jgi:3-hydroxypropanoate dehydrogenase